MSMINSSEFLDIINGKGVQNSEKAVIKKLRLSLLMNSNVYENVVTNNSIDTEQHNDNEEISQEVGLVVDEAEPVYNGDAESSEDAFQDGDCSVIENIGDSYIVTPYLTLNIDGKSTDDERRSQENNIVEDYNVGVNNKILQDTKVKDQKIDENAINNGQCGNYVSLAEFYADCNTNVSNCVESKNTVAKEASTEKSEDLSIVKMQDNSIKNNLTEDEKKRLEQVLASRQETLVQKKALSPKDYVEYASLSDDQKAQLAVFCCKKIRSMRKMSWIKKSIGWLRNKLSGKQDSFYCSDKNINEVFYRVEAHIERDAHKHHRIFRKSFDEKLAEEMLNRLAMTNDFSKNGCNIYDLVGIYKWYIRERLNGVLPESITKTLLELGKTNMFKNDKSAEHQDVMKYLPFAMARNARCVLSNMFTIFASIEDNYTCTEMDMKSLIICITPSLFDKDFFKKMEHAKIAVDIMNLLHCYDLEKIDKDVYDEFSAYYNKKMKK
ncbi:hypothetical protein BDAP_000211 [Binucleata daphniae]